MAAPEGGLLAPGSFVPAIEDTGLILELDMWVLETACRQAFDWSRSHERPLVVSTNLSAHHLTDPRFSLDVKEVLASTGLPAHQLCVEVTETALIQHPERAERTLGELRGLGLRVALDDFGTGYSFLAHLRRLPLTHIKIDHSFVAGLGKERTDEVIVQSTIELAHDLGLGVVGEGVETPEQFARLGVYRCDLAQGYLLGRPQPLEMMEQFLADEALDVSGVVAAT